MKRWVKRLPIVLLLLGSGAAVSAQRGARPPDIYFAVTRQVVVDQMLRLANVQPGDVVFDLGSGDGRIVILAAQKYGARGVGVEIDAALVERSRANAREAAVDSRVSFIQGDMFEVDISGADVVMLYLSPTLNSELEPKLRQQLRPGARIVSHQFPIGRWMPDRMVRAADNTELYLWTMR